MILYITRKFPPSVGGMQRFNAKLYAHLSRLTKIQLIHWGGSQAVLPFFLPLSFLLGLVHILAGGITCIYVSDGALAPLGWLLKVLTGCRCVATIHGRDIAFDNTLYQAVVPWCLRRLDRVACVSEALKTQCVRRGVPEENIAVIPNGIDVEDLNIEEGPSSRSRIQHLIVHSLEDRDILLTVGRLVDKKGVAYFLSDIFPDILKQKPETLYLIVGDGPQKSRIEKIIAERRLENHVFPLGEIPMEGGLLPAIYHAVDIFLMPNIRVEGDMEGFGIAALEASAAGLPVVAFNVDGIDQAVINDQNGILIPPEDRPAFVRTVVALLNAPHRRKEMGENAQSHVRRHYSWRLIAREYTKLLNHA